MLVPYDAYDHEERYQAKQSHYRDSKDAGEEPFDHEFDHAAERHVYVSDDHRELNFRVVVCWFWCVHVHLCFRFDRFTRNTGGSYLALRDFSSLTTRCVS